MTALYGITLFVHSYLRWALLAAVVVVLVRTISGWRRAREWERPDERWHAALVGLTDLQFMLGLALYVFLSPISSAFFANPGRMKDPVLRNFGLEHPMLMILAVVLIHVGRTHSKKASSAKLRHKKAWSWTLAGFVVMLAGIPWPFTHAPRALFRGFDSQGASVSAGAKNPSESCPPVYQTRCASCHGEQGRGDGVAARSLRPPPRDFADPAFRGRSDADIRAVIREGGAAHGLSTLMPPHVDLPNSDIDALVACVRAFRSARP